METSNEIKAKVFAPYIYQKVLHNGAELVILDKSWNWSHPSFKLLLKPLSAISGEDVDWLRTLLDDNSYEYIDFEDIINGLNGTYSYNIIGSVWEEIISGLRQRGYDFKNALLNGQTLHEAGLCYYEGE